MEVKIKKIQRSLPFIVLKVIGALFILPLSLVFYLTGLLLTLTIIGAVIGIPLVLSTYAMDVMALSILLNPKERMVKVYCPKCNKGKYIITTLMEGFTCKGCNRSIQITLTT
ncbi:MAG: hypothetical protein ACE5IH_03865 [Thermodesulfobacteriota bacterium]